MAHHNLEAAQTTPFASASIPYSYRHLALQDGSAVSLETTTGAYSVFVLSLSQGAQLHFSSLGDAVLEGEAVQIEHLSVSVRVQGGTARLLLAGSPDARHIAPRIERHSADAIKKVTKPWGHELWIHANHPDYAFKEIFIKAGTKTSLQYHRFKQETNVLFKGHAVLHYKADESAPLDHPSTDQMGTLELQPVSSIDVTPLVLHRIEACTDILLYEVSTPFLDDVIRVSDDSNRPDGHIATEHSA